MQEKISIEKTAQLLKRAKQIIRDEERIRELKGEDFNIFSILGAEFYENSTHSAFIAELLNPRGSHHKGSQFLRLFLSKVLKEHGMLKLRDIESSDYTNAFLNNKVYVFKEKHIGHIDEQLQTGGRIDILLKSGIHNITIENKINAKDQKHQLVRYFNYETENNLVFYLTLDGKSPEDYSKGALKEKNFKCISYKDDIRTWIEECIMHAYNEPILRESLKQYLILIKKITHQMEDQAQEKMYNLISDNLKTASAIYHNYLHAKDEIKKRFRKKVFELLVPVAEKHNLDINYGAPIDSKFSQIWLLQKNLENPALRFAVESFSGNHNDNGQGRMFYGLIVRNPDEGIDDFLELKYTQEESTKYWPSFEWIMTKSGTHLDLTNLDIIELMTKDDFVNTQAHIISENLDAFISANLENFKEINERFKIE
tara:strand:- start:362128 stop:363405 length:1278 start_codon:yes stop_codon:yes gene_type:complete